MGNGNQADDDRLQIRARIGVTGVEASALIFAGAKIPVGQANRPDINNCARPKLEDAKARCKAKEHKFIPSIPALLMCALEVLASLVLLAPRECESALLMMTIPHDAPKTGMHVQVSFEDVFL